MTTTYVSADEPCEECGGAGVHQGYGNFPGGDPRQFSPDEECSTPEERAAHERACKAWDTGNRTAVASACRFGSLPGGGYAHVTETRFGLGVYTIPCSTCGGSGEAVVEPPCKVCGTPFDEGCLCLLHEVTT